MSDLWLTCRCGSTTLHVRDVAPAVANRVVCSCSGCQAFANRFAPEILDEWGGTERLQVSPRNIAFDAGLPELRCVQQTPRGALRWVAGCCDTGLGLTLRSNRVPFVGLDLARLDQSRLERPLDEMAGPLRARVNTELRGPQARELNADTRSLFRMLLHLAPLTFRWWRAGDHLASPFFEGDEPVVVVERLYDQLPVRSLAGCR